MALSPAQASRISIGRQALRRELRLRYGPVERALADSFFDSGNLLIAADGFVMAPHDRLALRYERGEGLVCERADGVSDADVELWSGGFARGLIAWMNGFSVLHASAVERGGRALAFAGESGAGKSTLAAGLANRGFNLIEDDGLILEPQAGGGFHALAGRARVKLWESSLGLVDAGPGTPLADQRGKFAIDLESACEPDAAFLLPDLIILNRKDAGNPGFEEVRGRDKLTLLGQVLFREYLLPHLFGRAGCAAMLLRLAEGLRIWRYARPFDEASFPHSLECVERWFDERTRTDGIRVD